MEDARDNNIRQRYSLQLTLDEQDVKEDKAAATAPEQPTEADRDTEMNNDDTVVDIKARSLPPTYLDCHADSLAIAQSL